MFALENRVQEYAWGSREAIAALLGQGPSDKPQAELWMGAHPAASSTIALDGGRERLIDAIPTHADAFLGGPTRDRFGARLPFLLKVLAADQPLSLQAHPDEAQARRGFDAENAAGIPVDAPERTYRDPHHKPELICALTPFDALCGFRPAEALAEVFALLAGGPGDALVPRVDGPVDAAAVARLVEGLLALGPAARRELVSAVVEACRARAEAGGRLARAAGWALRLHELYPGDVGVVIALLLNDVHLEPGEALYLPPRRLHAYVQGVGIEIMASSDNVLRGGLTPKHVNVGELLRVLDFSPWCVAPVAPRRAGAESIYDTPAPEFRLSRIELDAASSWRTDDRRGPEIVLCTRGQASLVDARGAAQPLRQGGSIFVPFASGGYAIEGEGQFFRATVGL
ncbi:MULTISPECIES: mannose-6-phosphate isomerase, class I [Sorangium]|uniref:mannose-6-phosphate isomerase n=1 Tax=Sorangium cellulosum TaxID=56 RepID=A0A4P2QUS0_SORCE|nr:MULTISPECIES: mannose-6-phosphate isomerase, class I [Sorangium]AUX33888.1 mannose-6-phosphate isomerase [Sorangium cellulosum]WCQ93198.1 Mannose-6-phosphate isomerase [Sorangium sp. Soce836]